MSVADKGDGYGHIILATLDVPSDVRDANPFDWGDAMNAFTTKSAYRMGAICLGLAVAYFLAARSLIALSAPPTGMVLAVWLPSGISVAAMILFGPVAAVGALIGSLVFELSVGTPALGAVGMATANAGSEMLVWYLVTGRSGRDFSLVRTPDVGRFAAAVLLGSAVSATLGGLDYLWAGVVPAVDFWPNWMIFFGSVVTGIVLITPSLVYLVRSGWWRSTPRWTGSTRFLGTLAVIAVAAYVWQGNHLPAELRDAVLLLAAPPLLVAAFRFSAVQMSFAGFVFAVASIVGATGRVTEAGPTFTSLFSLQFMTTGVVILAYLLFAMVSEQNRANEKLQLWAKVFETSSEGIVITSADGTIVELNDACARIHKHTKEGMLGENPRIMKSDLHPPEFYQQMWDALLTEGEWRGEVWDRRMDGTVFPKLLSISAARNEQGETGHYVGVFSDITGIKLAEEQLRVMATHDALTGLPNRTLIDETLNKAMPRVRRSGKRIGVMFFDLDNFKNVNDTLGHAQGDRLLEEVARRLSLVIREGDMAARQGGDEFIVVAPDIDEIADLEGLARRVLEAVSIPYQLGTDEIHVSASIGVAAFPDDGDESDALIRHADLAMYRAKELGRGRCEFFSDDLQSDFRRRVDVETGLRQALRRDELFLEYQPQVDIETGRILSAEALVRWRKPNGTVVSPGEFIPIAEECGLIIPIGEWVLRTACRDIARLRNGVFPDLTISVNFSAHQFRQLDVADLVRSTLASSGLNPEALEIEVTETALMYDPEDAAAKLLALRREGVRVALDDFGTGYSSLKYLQLFRPDRLKIDRYFVQHIPADDDSRAIVAATLAIAHSLRIETIAEGTETEEQVRFLREQGCSMAQGFHFSRPVPLSRLEGLLSGDGVLPVPSHGLMQGSTGQPARSA